ncbi:MAG: DUF1929 domain-containing protein [Deltaproteobacteria bacterium]|nr:DUF1929 domain-containing protein [Deltaproteobacteria bacterium]
MIQKVRLSLLLTLAGPLCGSAVAATVQDFDKPSKGTPYVSIQTNNPPGPEVLPGGPTGSGNFLRLASATPQPQPPSANTITFPDTDPAADIVVIDFDFRLTPGNAVVPGKGRADGFGVALLNTAFFSAPGVASQGPVFAAEEPNFTGSLGIGFDLYKNGNLPGGYPDDIGNDNVRGPFVFSNSLSVHFHGQVLTQVDVSEVVDLAGGQWMHARIVMRPGGGFSDVSVMLTPRDCAPVTVVENLPVPGLLPYRGRLHFGARSGGETANSDIDNIKVQFLNSAQSLLSFRADTYRVEETALEVVISVERMGNISETVKVRYSATSGTAKSRSDYKSRPRTLTFAPGETSKSFSISIVNDTKEEDEETFFLSMKAIGVGRSGSKAVVGGPTKTVVTIFDDERSRIVGHWSPIKCWPIVAVHLHLLPTGSVMLWDRLGNSRLWNPTAEALTTPAAAEDNLFCSGHSFLPDGQLLVTGGHHEHGAPMDDGVGLLSASSYDAFTDKWTSLPDMNAGRWYPTNTTLGNEDVLVTSGSTDMFFSKNPLSQVWQSSSHTWRNLTSAQAQSVNLQALGVDLYPRMFLAPDGRVFKAGPDQDTWFLNTAGTGNWSAGPPSNFGLRAYGSAVMYAPGKILIVGGGNVTNGNTPADDATTSAEVLDLNAATPGWRIVAPMQFPRRHVNATLLPDGTVLVTGGVDGPGFNNEAKPILPAELWNPETETWTTLPAMQATRGYHSNALLLPDGSVISAGGGEGAGATGHHTNAEAYFPAYLFKGPRPVIDTVPANVDYGYTFLVETPDAASIAKVSLIRLPSVTHAFDQNQRFNSLEFSQAADGLHVSVPINTNLAPPGHYMLFIVNGNGVPSVASIIAIGGVTPPDQPTISFTYVPPYGSFQDLQGQVDNVDSSAYKIAVFIRVRGGWWTKPYWDTPLTPIRPDGTWTCDITTGGVDQEATAIVAYLVPNGYNPPLMGGQSSLPAELELNSITKAETTRTP